MKNESHFSTCLTSFSKQVTCGLTLVLLLGTSAAAAEERGGVRTQFLERDTSYEFDDDPMTGTSLGADSERIRVRPRGHRAMLIRPRVHFVREIFKSAEDL